jgi:dihydropteroate synthase-like protein
MQRPSYLFVTGKLAEPALRRMLADAATSGAFDYQVAVLPISVAALATTPWIARHLQVPPGIDRVVVPGLCQGDICVVGSAVGTAVERGPKDLRDLPEFLGSSAATRSLPVVHDVTILAEINSAQRLPMSEIHRRAAEYCDSGADVIDLGCDPGQTWLGVSDAVRSLRENGHRVSIDSFNPKEVGAAIKAGAELVLSVNSSNREAAIDWGCEVVVIPDSPTDLNSLDSTVERLAARGIPFRIDPVIEPIGFGFAASLGRYLEVRRRYPDAEMMMGVGNLTELTEVDSAGINVLLMGFCQELKIRSVLTTEVINWCRSCVHELCLARRLAYHACQFRVLPKHLEPSLLQLRDAKLHVHGEERLRELAATINDPNVRLFAERGLLHALSGKMFLQARDAFKLFAEIQQTDPVDADHAFYLGYEMAKAVTALTLGKNYVQDQPLNWGFLTVPEKTQGGRMGAGEDRPNAD